jgi:6-pyruvoyltetrahydropterin/6-carboxytetrahydropterin synthase
MNVTTKVEVAIGHRLLGYEGKCGHIHGHNYVFEITVQGNPDGLGMVYDFKDLKKSLREILDPFDHALVLHHEDPAGELLPMEKLVLLSVNPTAENFASLVYGKLVDRNYAPARVVVKETEDGWAEAIGVDRSVRVRVIQ